MLKTPNTKFCAVTPTRGDRPQFLDFCKYQISRMERKPDAHYLIDYKPRGDKKDLVDRVRMGVSMAKNDGFDFVFIIEDDDYYPANYFNLCPIDRFDFIGSQTTTYYRITDNGFDTEKHPGRSSLFSTGFRISSLQNFKYPNNVFLDLALWQHAGKRRLKRFYYDAGAIGIKHGIGLCGGVGHTQRYKNHDNGFEWLSERVDSEALYFYKMLQNKIDGR